MKRIKWELRLGAALVLISIFVYTIKYLLFGDVKSTFNFLFNVLGYLPINVLLVTMILNQLLAMRSKREKMQKVNLVIEVFFSELGTELLRYLSRCDSKLEKVQNALVVTDDWSLEEFKQVQRKLNQHECDVDIQKADLQGLYSILKEKRDFLLRLLENPAILEQGSFTKVLQAIFHLTEELEKRDTFEGLPDADYKHLEGDIRRVYDRLLPAWLDYLEYLRDNYPYLFSLAIRTNPFDNNNTAVLTD
jgi:hypothetical protein